MRWLQLKKLIRVFFFFLGRDLLFNKQQSYSLPTKGKSYQATKWSIFSGFSQLICSKGNDLVFRNFSLHMYFHFPCLNFQEIKTVVKKPPKPVIYVKDESQLQHFKTFTYKFGESWIGKAGNIPLILQPESEFRFWNCENSGL